MLSAAAALYGALTDIREIYFSEAANSVCVQEKKKSDGSRCLCCHRCRCCCCRRRDDDDELHVCCLETTHSAEIPTRGVVLQLSLHKIRRTRQ